MGFFAWTQDVPIDAAAYAAIADRIGDARMPGLVLHVAMRREDGSVHYLDVWESVRECDEAFEQVVHPAVHPVLVERGVHVQGEPPRIPVEILEVRTAEGSLLPRSVEPSV